MPSISANLIIDNAETHGASGLPPSDAVLTEDSDDIVTEDDIYIVTEDGS